jgi:heptosyltransferase-2
VTVRLSGRERVLVRAPSWLGDFVAAEPSLRALASRVESPGVVAVAAPARLLELLDGRFASLRRIPIGPGSPESSAAWREHDVALLLNGSLRSAWHAWRAAIPLRAGFARGGRGPLLSHGFVPARERGGTPHGLGRAGRGRRFLPRPFGDSCVELLGWLGVGVADRLPRLLVSDRSREAAAIRLEAAGLARGAPYLLVNAGSRPDSAKGAPPDVFAAAIDALAPDLDCQIVLACAPGEEDAAREAARLLTMRDAILLDDPPSDLAELCALAASARLAIGPDNGARHVAEALGTPCVVLCGPTDPRHTATHPRTTKLLSVEVPCGPCHLEVCPLAGEARHACMRRIGPEAVAAAAFELLG